ncbi:MAG: AraC family transcriptional regulator [Cyclobacteriaceae bacterium]|nr:AraC family transcriptional regulator [Cyclobacteriaceae bacterium]
MEFFNINQSFSQYFVTSEDDEAWGIHILDCGASIVPRGAVFPQRSHPDKYYFNWHRGRVLNVYQIIYLFRGQGIFESRESGKINLKQGSAIVIFPGIWHRYKPLVNEEWQTYWVGFDGKIAKQIMDKLHFLPENPVQEIGYQKKIIQIFQQIFETGQAEFSGYQLVLSGEIVKLAGWLHALKRKAEFGDYDADAIIRKARIIIMNSPDDVSMDIVADELNMGYSKFRKLFKEYTGLAPGQYQIQLKLKRAINLLHDKNKPIKEIAMESGFKSPYYFSRIFKKKLGCSPLSFRNKLFSA